MTEDVWTLIKMGGCALAAVLVWCVMLCRCRRLDRIDVSRRMMIEIRKGESCPTDSH